MSAVKWQLLLARLSSKCCQLTQHCLGPLSVFSQSPSPCFLLIFLNLTTLVTLCMLLYLYDLSSASHSYLAKHQVSGKHHSVVCKSPTTICLKFHSHPQLHFKYCAKFKIQFYNKQKHYCYKYITLQPHYINLKRLMDYSRVSNHYNSYFCEKMYSVVAPAPKDAEALETNVLFPFP